MSPTVDVRGVGRVGARPATAPVPAAATALLSRSDAELVAAQLAADPAERFLHAHLAALRAGAAVLEVTGRPGRRGPRGSVWDLVAAAVPELTDWCNYFASGASLRAAVESGREPDVDPGRAERTCAAAEDFHDTVRALLEGAQQGLRAS